MTSLIGGGLKNVLSLILDRFLKPYVDDFDSRKLDLGLLSGLIKLKNLKIKKGALDNFRLPIDVIEGHLGELTMKVPYTSLGSTPVEMVIEDLYLLVVPAAGGHVDPAEDERRAQAAKQDRLENAELLQTRGPTEVTEDASKNQGFIQALTAKVVNNVQISIKNIHIRYEDALSCPGHPFAAGITLAGFTAQTTDGGWKPAFVQSTAGSIHKLATLESLSLYFNTDEDSISGLPIDQSVQTFKSLIASKDNRPPHQYTLQPVTGEGRITINHHINSDTPRFDVQVLFDELGFTLDDNQYRDAISMVDMYHFYVRQAQYRRYRPSQEALQKNRNLALLKFAGESILREVHERRRKWTWDYFRERRDQRHLYVALFKRKQDGPPLGPAEGTTFDDLEARLTYEDIRFYRSIARSELKKDRAARKRIEEQQRKQQPKATGGWFGGWGWGGNTESQSTSQNENSEDGMTEEQRQELYKAINYDERAAPLITDAPGDALKLRVSASLTKGSFSLRKKGNKRDSPGTELISIVFDSFRSELLQRIENLGVTMTLGDFSVFDGTCPGTLHHKIVRVKEEQSPSEQVIEIGNEPLSKDSLFHIVFEQNPLDQHADSCLAVRMKALEIVYHKGYVEAIFNFFRPPESQLESVGALLSAATETLGELRNQSRAGLEYALQTHKTVDIKLDLKSPIIIIPEDVRTKSCQHLVLDAGHISIRSDLVPKSEILSIQAKRKQQYTDADFEKLESLMYDKFFLQLESAQLVIGNDLDSCMMALASLYEGRELHLLERINMEFSVQMSIIPDAPNLARFKVSGKMPSLALNFSNMKYKGLMRLIDISIPKLGDDQPQSTLPTVPRPDPFSLPAGLFRTTEEYVVDDDHSTVNGDQHSDDDDDEKDSDTFVDADMGGSYVPRALLHQHLFEFAFQVEKLQASLLKATSDGVEKPLADLVLDRFSLDFALAKFDMRVKVSLRSLSVHQVDQIANRRIPLILSSDDSGSLSHESGTSDLVQVNYVRVQAESPEFMTVYEGIDQSITVALSTFIVHAAPEPIIGLYDFIMTTFVASYNDPNNTPPPKEDVPHDLGAPPAQPQAGSGKIRVRVNLTTIELVLINGEQKLATLALSAADAAVFVRGNTLRVGARLGRLSLTDESALKTIDPAFKQIISIDDDELADFTYETFDPAEKDTFPGVNSLVHLRFASLKVSFIEEPIRDIYRWLVKFAELKSLYDAASQAAAQRASEITRMKFDVIVKSPIIVFPRDPSQSHDVVLVKLGEISASNAYRGRVTTTTAGLNGISVTSLFYYDNQLAELPIVDDVEISSVIIQTDGIDRSADLLKPDTAVDVKMSDVKVGLTQAQYIFLLQLSQAIPRVLAAGPEAVEDAVRAASTPSPTQMTPRKSEDSEHAVDLAPELGLAAHTASGQDLPRWSSVDVAFTVKALALNLYDKNATDKESLKRCGVAGFNLKDNAVRFKMLSDGATQTEVILKSFTVGNTRAGNSRFREIIPAAKHDRNQFMVLYSTTGGPKPSSSAVVSIDSPKVIFAIDPVFALIDLFTSPFSNVPADRAKGSEPVDDGDSADDSPGSNALSVRVDLHEVSVSVLERDDDPNTQAIQLTIKEILMAQQGILALTINRLGMSLMCMNKPSERVSFLDEIDVTLTLDSRQPSGRQMTSVELTVQPIIFRASMRDINLITTIVNKVLELSSASGNKQIGPSKSSTAVERPRVTSVKQSKPSSRRDKSGKSRRRSSGRGRVIMSTEKLKATFDGFRLILIGDIHEFPLLHLDTKAFNVNASDWSGELQANMTFVTSITYWNLTNSHWEPLIDPWAFSISVHKDVVTGALTTTLSSQERLDVNLTTTFVELALTTANIWSKEGDRVLKRARGGDAPYQIINRTGAPIEVQSESDNKRRGTQATPIVSLSDGQTIDWRFDDWRTMRENVSSSRNNAIAVTLQGRNPVNNIPVDREGEFIYALRPKTDKVADRLLCEVTVRENVKVITLRSTFKLENNTLYPIDVILVDRRGKPSYPLQKLSPGQDYAIPIEAILQNDIQVRPDPGFGYGWADKPIRWQDFIRSPARTVSCPCKEKDSEVPFRFQAWAMYDAADPIIRTYPKMTLRLRAPIEFENLLPYDVRYTIYDRDTQKKWRSYLRRGGLMPIHCVHLDQFVLFNVEIQDTTYKPSEFAIINAGDSPDFGVESILRVADQQDRKLDLGINYVKYEDSGGAFRMQLYSPFVAINKTGFPFNIRSGNSRPIAGQVGNDSLAGTTPFMFSHPKEQGAEFMLRLGNTSWSKVLNFEAPSADTAVTLASTSSQANKEIHLGISWTPGLGKYKLTKVITIAPRFVIKNELPQQISFRECGDPASDAPLRPGQSAPVHAFSSGRDLAISLKYPGVDRNWTSSIPIQDIGVVHTRLGDNQRGKPDLARVEVSIGGSTIWVTIKLETEAWPFRIENASDYTFNFFQTDDRRSTTTKMYTLNAHSEADYAWDVPSAREKRLKMKIGENSRVVDILEIGDLVPFRFGTENGYRVVSLDVRAEGSMQILTISNYSEETSLYRRRTRSSTIDSTNSRQDTLSSQSEAFEAITEEVAPSMAVNIEFDGIGISLINRRLVEVVYLTLSKLKLEYTDSEVAQTINLACGWIQIDNQLHEAIYPILLQPMMVSREGNALDVLPAIQGSAIVLKDQSHGVLFIKYASVLLQALSIQMDEDFLFALLDLTKMHGVSWETEEVDVLTEHPSSLPPPHGLQDGQNLYFEVLELQPMRLSLSFTRTERVNADEKLTLRNPLAVMLNAFTMTIGNINDAPLRLNALAIKDMRLTVPVLQERIVYHYKQEVLRQLYRILGSADFIGNPVGLFTNVSSGVADIFYEPYKGVVMHGSKELGIGIAKGAASFAKKTVFGLTDSMTKVTSSIGKGLSAATFDSEYQRQRRLAQRKNRPGNAIYGVAAGAEALATSFSSGLEGVVMKPIEGAEREGAFGFFKGVGKGLVGAITKPAVGVFDLAANFTEGIRNTTTVFDNTQRNRKRIPRHSPADGILMPYSQREALGQSWLKDVDNGNYRSESYVAHIELPEGDTVVMLTTSRVLCLSPTKLRLIWDLPFPHIEKVAVADTGITFCDKSGREYDQFVRIPQASSKNWFFQEIEKVIKQWNASRRVER